MNNIQSAGDYHNKRVVFGEHSFYGKINFRGEMTGSSSFYSPYPCSITRYAKTRSGKQLTREVYMRDVEYMHVAEDSMNKIKEGAFLTVKSAKGLNTMTIGWASFGVIWGKPIMMVAVRSSRHTFAIIEAAEDFTVTVPAGDMRRQTAYCGSKSGRDVDKFAQCNLQTSEGRRVVSPIIKTEGRHYECAIIYKSAMNPTHFRKDYDPSLYPKKDYHTLYFGEILACYETD